MVDMSGQLSIKQVHAVCSFQRCSSVGDVSLQAGTSAMCAVPTVVQPSPVRYFVLVLPITLHLVPCSVALGAL